MKPVPGSEGVVIIEGHVQGLANTRALGKAGIPVMVVSQHDCLARYSKYCRKFFRCPDYLSAEFIDFLLNLAATEDIQDWILLPSNDHAVYNISSHLPELGKYYRIIAPEPGILESIYNKERLIGLCQSAGIRVPESWFPGSPGELNKSGLKFPLLLKGKNGLSFYKRTGRKAILIEDYEKMQEVLDEMILRLPFSDIYLQEMIPLENNKTVSFTAFSVDGEIKAYWMGMKIREHPVHFGTATYSRGTLIPELLPAAGTFIKKLKYTGVCEIEFMFDPRDQFYKLIEVNARTWLWVDLAIRSGINYPLMIYNYLNHINTEYPTDYSADKEWLHYLTDLPFTFLGLIRGHYSLRGILDSYKRLPAPAVFNSSDILPSFAEILLLPSLIINR
jgi:predicted ATP-grasp superfamily ATP-dependent carboligase